MMSVWPSVSAVTVETEVSDQMWACSVKPAALWRRTGNRPTTYFCPSAQRQDDFAAIPAVNDTAGRRRCVLRGRIEGKKLLTPFVLQRVCLKCENKIFIMIKTSGVTCRWILTKEFKFEDVPQWWFSGGFLRLLQPSKSPLTWSKTCWLNVSVSFPARANRPECVQARLRRAVRRLEFGNHTGESQQ